MQSKSIKPYKYRAVSKYKPSWWEGFYVYSHYEEKHFIVQSAIPDLKNNGSYLFAHFAEVDFSTLSVFTGKKDVKGNEIFTGDVLSKKWQAEVYLSKSNNFMVKFNTNPKVNRPQLLNVYLSWRSRAGTIDRDGLIVDNVFHAK